MENRNTNNRNRRVREQARQVNQTQHRKRRRKNYILHYILISVLILAIGITLSVTVFFNVEEIVVEGNETHTLEEIVDYSQVRAGDNLFRMNMDHIKKRILSRTIDLDAVTVERKLPDTLKITLTQSTPVSAYKIGADYYIISSGGRIIAQTADISQYPDVMVFSGSDLSQYKLGDFVQDTEEYAAIHRIAEAMHQIGLEKITSLALNEDMDVKFCYDNRITVEFGSVVELEYRLKMVKMIIDDYINGEEGIIDARTVGTAYFRPMTMEVQIAEGKAVGAAPQATEQSDSQADSQPDSSQPDTDTDQDPE